jgi:predicted ferric reductase
MSTTDPSARESAIDPRAALLGASVGALVAVALVPTWVPAAMGTLTGEAPRAFWYLSRASGLTAYGLIWLSVITGLLQSGGLGRELVRGPALFELHRHAAWAGLAFATFHALVLLGDRHAGGSLAALAIPFAMVRHAPGWVGLGQLALYGGVVVAVSFRLRGRIGARAWRALHFASFTVFVLVVAHAVLSGTDAGEPWVAAYYGSTLAVVALLASLRALRAR